MIYIVSGFFRSGTSMMMQALEEGGLSIYKNLERDRLNERNSDATYRMNPISLYEPSPKDLREPGFPRQHDGMALKLLIPWLGSMAVHEYRVLVMKRDPFAILESYQRAFNEYWSKPAIDRFVSEYPGCIQEAIRWFGNRRDVKSLDVVEFDDILGSPLKCFIDLDWPVDPIKSTSVVDPKLRRVS